jgi:hypothetical protein
MIRPHSWTKASQNLWGVQDGDKSSTTCLELALKLLSLKSEPELGQNTKPEPPE